MWVVLLAPLLGAVVAVATPTILRSLPAPIDEPDSDPYRPLATPGFVWQAFALVSAACAVPLSLLSGAAAAWLGLSTVGILLALVDARTGYLPRLLTVAGWVLTSVGTLAAALLTGEPWLLVRAGGGAAAVTALFWLFWRFGRGFGFGDVRLAPIVGGVAAAAGWPVLAMALIAGGLLGAGCGLVRQLLLRRGDAYPYGPALVAGPYLALLWGGLVPA